MTLQALLFHAEQFLARAGSARPAFEARYLLAGLLGLNHAELFLYKNQQLSQAEQDRYQDMLEQRGQGRPLQYIIGTTHFWTRDFIVTPDVLIPRPETEYIVEQALAELHAFTPKPQTLKLLDLGTGSGVIADILADELGCTVVGVDISWPALQVARRNICEHGLSRQVSLICSDLFSAFARGTTFDAIIANLPYVETDVREKLDREVVDHEPALALFAGPDGLDCYRRCIAEAGEYLCTGGALLLEIGATQGKAVAQLLTDNNFVDIEIRHDYAGLPRCVCARKA